MSSTTEAPDLSETKSHKPTFRPEIEGLRAVAAVLVAIFHIWVGGVSGGVDVFFVVSGFLITTTLLKQIERHGKIRPLSFLGRLLRRLVPSALVVLTVTLAATWVFTPDALKERTFREITASSLYYENWALALSSVDYLNKEDPHTAVQHFWAMSTQGQFYVIWAALFFLAGLVVINRGRRVKISLILIIGSTLTSFVYSIWLTSANQPFAYFSPFTRVWEFGLGAILAFVIARVSLGKLSSFILGWVGLIAVLICGFVLPVGSSFPDSWHCGRWLQEYLFSSPGNRE